MTSLVLLPLVVVIVGFAFRMTPPLVVLLALASCALAPEWGLLQWLERIGDAFKQHRVLLTILLVFPLVAVLERFGLRQQVMRWARQRNGLSLFKVLIGYLGLRQLGAALGMTSLGGQAQSVRPLLVPMLHGLLPERSVHLPRVSAFAAATDNVALFFGEDLFLAFGAVLLMQSSLAALGHTLSPLEIALWGIPTAVTAFSIHAWRAHRLAHQWAKASAEAGRSA